MIAISNNSSNDCFLLQPMKRFHVELLRKSNWNKWMRKQPACVGIRTLTAESARVGYTLQVASNVGRAGKPVSSIRNFISTATPNHPFFRWHLFWISKPRKVPITTLEWEISVRYLQHEERHSLITEPRTQWYTFCAYKTSHGVGFGVLTAESMTMAVF
jgi:hypothetical protein